MQDRSRRTQEAVLAAALKLFGERGYDATGMSDIATRAGVAVGAVYRHYRTKRQLLLVLIDLMLAEIDELDLSVPEGTGPRAAVTELLRRGLATDARYMGAYRAWQDVIAREPQLAAVDREIVDWTSSRVALLLEVARQLPDGRPDMDVPATARLLTLLLWRLVLESPAEVERLTPALDALVGHLLFTDRAP